MASNIAMLWQWHDYGDKYVDYSIDQLKVINTSLSQQVSKVTLTLKNPTRVYTLNVKDMSQTNESTGFLRDVRCGIQDTNTPSDYWFWMIKGKNGEVRGLQKHVCEKLEETLSAGAQKVCVDNVGYDLKNMKQEVTTNQSLELVRMCCKMNTCAENAISVSSAKPRKIKSVSSAPSETGVRRSSRVKSAASAATSSSVDNSMETDDEPKTNGKKRKAVSRKGKQDTKRAGEQKSDVKKISDAAHTKKLPSIADEIEEKKKKLENGKSSADKGSTRKKGKSENTEKKAASGPLLVRVDSKCSLANKAKVYIESGNIYDATLNQTNIGNNNNKYYIMQLLEVSGAVKQYYVWFRWGRVGYDGQNSLFPYHTDLKKAKSVFTKKFSDKTRNEWEFRADFEHFTGKYDLVFTDYSAGDDEDGDEASEDEVDSEPGKKKEKVEELVCELDPKVQALIKLICDKDLFESTVREMEFDINKNPLGKLTEEQIKSGYEALKEIAELLEASAAPGHRLVQACNVFYTRIPHYFGMRIPPLIKTPSDVKKKIELLEALGNIQLVVDKMNAASKANGGEKHPLTRNYDLLKCEIKPVLSESREYKIISEYLQHTHASTHSTYKMRLKEVFELVKDGEDEAFNDVGNKMLLWHGSRLTNYAGILSNGLRIAPPEAPVTGYMFGKGVYFADRSSKSANYCFATPKHKTGLVLLCEVSLGNCNELCQAKYDAHKLPSGKNSTLGKGLMVPSGESEKIGSATVPLGKTVKRQLQAKESLSLQYNEYCIYDVRQIKMKYLLHVDFDFSF